MDRGIGEQKVWVEWNDLYHVLFALAVVLVGAFVLLRVGWRLAERFPHWLRCLVGVFCIVAYGLIAWGMSEQFRDFYAQSQRVFVTKSHNHSLQGTAAQHGRP